MKIGQALRQERLKLGLTQKEMCQGILSRSFYAKVERDKYRINAASLFKILFKNQIDVTEFADPIQEHYDTEENKLNRQFETKIEHAVNTKNIKALTNYCQQLLALPNNEILKLRAMVTLAYFKNELDTIDESTRKQIKTEFDEGKNWIERIEVVRLLANTMPAWSQDELDFLIGRFLASIKNKKISELMLERYLILLSNYLVVCYKRKIFNNKNYYPRIKEVIAYILSSTSTFHLMIYKIPTLYMKALFEHDVQEIKEIKKELKDYGYSEITVNWPN